MNKEIKAVEIINFKKVSEYLTGKSFNIRSDRDFGKHKSNIDELIEAIEYWMSDIVEEVEKPKWKIEAEKKSNPTDYITDEVAVEKHKKHNHKSSIEIGKGVYDAPKVANLINDEAGQFVGHKKVDMDALRKIAAGEGLKGEFSLTKKKVVIDELYDFEIGSLPDIDDRVYVDKKSIAMVDKYNPGVYYVIWEGRNLMFTQKAEFDRFAKDNLILI
jgi:hypothetical protein